MTYPSSQSDPNHHANGAPFHPNPPQYDNDFFRTWGIKPLAGRPQKITLLLQSLWAYAAASVLIAFLSLVAAASLPYYIGTSYFTSAAVISLVFGAGAIAVAWFVVKEKLGLFGADDPRITLSIGLGIIGFFALYGFFGGWGVSWYSAFGVLLGLVQVGSVGLAFAMVFQPETHQWLLSRPGNRPNPPQQPGGTPPQQPPSNYPPH